jgi:uncharacterized membrane protein
MFALDFVWVGNLVADYYVSQFTPIGRIADGKFVVIPWAAISVYLCMAIGLVLFVVPKAEIKDPLWKTTMWGALFGFSLYGTYDLTNYAFLKDWPIGISFADIAWGTFLCAVAGTVGRFTMMRKSA